MWNQEKLEIEPRKMELFFLQKTGAEVDKLGLNLLNQEQCRFLPRWDGEGFKPGVAYFRRHLLFHIYLSIHRFLVAWTVPSFLCKKNYIPSFIKTLIDLNCLWFKSHIVFSLLKHAKTTLFFFCFFSMVETHSTPRLKPAGWGVDSPSSAYRSGFASKEIVVVVADLCPHQGEICRVSSHGMPWLSLGFLGKYQVNNNHNNKFNINNM